MLGFALACGVVSLILIHATQRHVAKLEKDAKELEARIAKLEKEHEAR